MGSEIGVALKEWSSVIAALRSGRQTLLLRKGGIAERRKGFAVEHDRFLLYPSYVHQQVDFVEPEALAAFEASAQPPDGAKIRFDTFAEVVEAIALDHAAQAHLLAPHHIWNDRFIDQRLAWKPDDPAWLLVVRAFPLPEPVEIDALRRYAGCRSWVSLEDLVQAGGVAPVLSDADFANAVRSIHDSLEAARV